MTAHFDAAEELRKSVIVLTAGDLSASDKAATSIFDGAIRVLASAGIRPVDLSVEDVVEAVGIAVHAYRLSQLNAGVDHAHSAGAKRE